jgi:hypothetical protein
MSASTARSASETPAADCCWDSACIRQQQDMQLLVYCVACWEPCCSRFAAGAYLPVQRRAVPDGSRCVADSSVGCVELRVAQQRLDSSRPAAVAAAAAAAAAKVLNPAAGAVAAAKRQSSPSHITCHLNGLPISTHSQRTVLLSSALLAPAPVSSPTPLLLHSALPSRQPGRVRPQTL